MRDAFSFLPTSAHSYNTDNLPQVPLFLVFSLSKKSHGIIPSYMHSITVSLYVTPASEIFPFDVSGHRRI